LHKERLDILLVNKGFFESREKARSSIMAGVIFVNGEKIDKPGTKVNEDSSVEIKGNTNPYVSRGGLKLEKAMKAFDIILDGKTAMDVGASTGGFTDCMLKNGAKKVYSVDVGYGQLAWTLRNDPRVVCMERTNIRFVKPEDIGEPVEFVSIDVSFISLKKVLLPVYAMLAEKGEVICLIKPQFEAGRDKVGKHGVVREPEVHREVIRSIIDFTKENGFTVKGLTFSPIRGPEGNIEYLIYLSKESGAQVTGAIDVHETVNEAHSEAL